jgi:hypothetical protein
VDKFRYSQAVNSLENDVQNGVRKYPLTLSAAFQYVLNFIVTKLVDNKQQQQQQQQQQQNNKQNPPSIYATTGGESGQQKKQGKKKQGKKKAASDDSSKSGEKAGGKPERAPPSPCDICAAMGLPDEMHWQSKCPKREAALDMIGKCAKAEKSVKFKNVYTAKTSSTHSDSEDDDYLGGTYKSVYTTDLSPAILSINSVTEDDSERFMVRNDNQADLNLIYNRDLLHNLRPLTVSSRRHRGYECDMRYNAF